MGVLSGIRVLEFEAIGPGPFGAMLLADMGADVVRVDRPVAPPAQVPRGPEAVHIDVVGRGRRSVTLDLKNPEGVDAALDLIERADVLIEGLRPGTMERLGLGPEAALARNPKLVYGRMTGWGQNGPLAHSAGHDMNYIALSGVLCAMGTQDKPIAPLNLLGDYGGGGMLLALGVVSALLHVQRGGTGQVVDAAMVEGAAQLGSLMWGLLAAGHWKEGRGNNLLDGGAPWYDTYRTLDGQHMAVGAVEPQFYAELVQKLGLADAGLPKQHDRGNWPRLREAFTQAFASRTREEWTRIFDGSDACVAPVLGFAEAPLHPHNRQRGSFVELDGVLQPAPAPRFSATPSALSTTAPRRGERGAAALRDWGFDAQAIERLRRQGLGFADAQQPEGA
ncbi:CaiB/BaiF CoA-transferase family protein [Variovorax sp. OV329]|uniref:CaiB/BaiF CoA transferase family protein n=1 Tax=Variovorax sp. OV329 TaxID=1882825 RepID=UPI0008E46770|nr:CaiB/BaiF CoA-transferase family protein [Variovorax sp. OV329]SFN02669.1 alpha-methylacyl-CoA racemase [Variovorax sp. OV329]